MEAVKSMATCGDPAMTPEPLSHLAWDGLLHPSFDR